VSDSSAKPGDTPPFSRVIRLENASALQGRLEASATERQRLADVYQIGSLASLSFDYRLDPLPSHRYRLTGSLKAELTQPCVVTLEPVQQTMREEIALELWPEPMLRDRGEDGPEAEEVLDMDPPEPIVNGRIDLGHLAAEIFASAIDPYPRKADAAFEWTDPQEADEAARKPFAGLARLKSKA
jgi:uncharacterized metal-binding protein YceD (DUF177 family)